MVRRASEATHDTGGHQLARWKWTWSICPLVAARMLQFPGFGDIRMSLPSLCSSCNFNESEAFPSLLGTGGPAM